VGQPSGRRYEIELVGGVRDGQVYVTDELRPQIVFANPALSQNAAAFNDDVKIGEDLNIGLTVYDVVRKLNRNERPPTARYFGYLSGTKL
jgi:hypothetical protein